MFRGSCWELMAREVTINGFIKILARGDISGNELMPTALVKVSTTLEITKASSRDIKTFIKLFGLIFESASLMSQLVVSQTKGDPECEWGMIYRLPRVGEFELARYGRWKIKSNRNLRKIIKQYPLLATPKSICTGITPKSCSKVKVERTPSNRQEFWVWINQIDDPSETSSESEAGSGAEAEEELDLNS